jgi:hypothetical protein
MSTETERPTFRGVECLHCKASIPVPAIVGNRLAVADEGTETSQRKSQVFNLRCPSCHKEKPYRTREIVDFEGTSESALAADHTASAPWYPEVGFVRAAKA